MATTKPKLDFIGLSSDELPTPRRGAGRPSEELDEQVKASIAAILDKLGAVASTLHYSAKAEDLEQYNAERRKAWEKKPRKDGENFKPLSLVGMAARIADSAGTPVRKYVEAIAEEKGLGVSFRPINDGTDDAPSIRWAYTLTTARKRNPQADEETESDETSEPEPEPENKKAK